MTTGINLIDFPDELLEKIAQSFGFWTDVVALDYKKRDKAATRCKHLNSFSQTCKKVHLIVIPILYEVICFGTDQSLMRLNKTLSSKPELSRYTRTVSIDYRDNTENEMNIWFLSKLPQLQHIFICNQESGDSTDDEDETAELWAQAWQRPVPGARQPLSSLKTCTLKFTDDNGENWSPMDALGALRHPTLECLVFDGIDMSAFVGDDTWEMLYADGSYPTLLKELHFFNSDFAPQGLKFVLQHTKKLKALTLSDREGYAQENRGIYPTEEYVNTIAGVAPNLEYFRVQDSGVFFNLMIGFAFFFSLRILDVHYRHLFSRDVEGSENIPFKQLFPPNIEVLRLQGFQGLEEQNRSVLFEIAQRRSTLIPKLQTLVLDGYDELWMHEGWYLALKKESGVDIAL